MSTDPKPHIVLYEPVIPQNTGSIARLAACTGSHLHLVHPLGFQIDDAAVKRAGLDYWPFVDISDHVTWDAFLESEKPETLYFFSKLASTSYTTIQFSERPFLIFGNETKGLPGVFRRRYPEHFYQIPMRTHVVRSLNLAQCVAIVVYEVLRQWEWH